jgi:hypothetical protein
MRRRLLRTLLALLMAACAGGATFVLLLRVPGPFFRYGVTEGGLSLWAAQPFDPESGRQVLRGARARLMRSPAYTPGESHAAFVTGPTGWRHLLYFAPALRAGGANCCPFTTNVFLSGAIVERDRLVSPSGRVVEAARPLEYFIAHEVTHTYTCRMVGPVRSRLMEDWLKEGYSEYVGRGPGFDLEQDARAFLAEVPEMNQPRDVPYLRYRFLVAYLLERKRMSVREVLDIRATRAEIEQRVRSELIR